METFLLTGQNGQQENIVWKRNQTVWSQFIENTIMFQAQVEALSNSLQIDQIFILNRLRELDWGVSVPSDRISDIGLVPNLMKIKKYLLILSRTL